MKRCPLTIIGGGEHAAVVADAALRQRDRWTVIGYLDRGMAQPMARYPEVKYLGDDKVALEAVLEGEFILGVGAVTIPLKRAEIAARFDAAGARWTTVIHPSAQVAATARIGPGAVVLANTVVGPGAVVGEHAVVNNGAIIEHDVIVGRHAIVSPGAVTGGGTRIGELAVLGLGCRVRDHLTIGDRTMIGMGAVVVEALPAGVVAFGVPARVQRTI